MRFIVALCGALTLTVLSTPVMGAVIVTIDQQNLIGGFDTDDDQFGQTFTPSLNGIDAIELRVSRSSIVPDTVAVDLFEGTGFGGTLLGTTNSLVLTNGPNQVKHFDFAATIPLTAGNTYTFRARLISATGDFDLEFSNSDTYSGGEAIGFSAASGGNIDLWFVTGLHTAVPEPPLALLFAACVGALRLLKDRADRTRSA